MSSIHYYASVFGTNPLESFNDEQSELDSSWVAKAPSSAEEKGRQEAIDRIRKFEEDPHAYRLDLTHLDLSELPPGFFNRPTLVKKLEDLCLSNNKIMTLPSEIGSLGALKSLTLSSNPLRTLPSEIMELQETCQIDLTDCPLRIEGYEGGYNGPISHPNLSTFVAKCSHDRQLSHDAWIEIDAWAKEACVLNEKAGRKEAVKKIRAFEENPDASRLYLEHSHLTNLPSALFKLPALIERLDCLFLNNNWLTDLPSTISSLSALTDLYVNSTLIRALRSEIASLPALTELYIYNTNLTTLLPTIMQSKNIRKVNVSNCPLSVATIDRIKKEMSAIGYKGPQIFYTKTPTPEATAAELLKNKYWFLLAESSI